MNVAQLCSRNVISVRRIDEVVRAARLMREHHVGYIVVTEPDFAGSTERPIGVLTDRDIVVGIIARERDPRSLVVGDVMTENPVVLGASDSIAAAEDPHKEFLSWRSEFMKKHPQCPAAIFPPNW